METNITKHSVRDSSDKAGAFQLVLAFFSFIPLCTGPGQVMVKEQPLCSYLGSLLKATHLCSSKLESRLCGPPGPCRPAHWAELAVSQGRALLNP